jgi:hypothetical protein
LKYSRWRSAKKVKEITRDLAVIDCCSHLKQTPSLTHGLTPSEYIRRSVIDRLEADGFDLAEAV